MLTVEFEGGRLEFDKGQGTFSVFADDAELFRGAGGRLVTSIAAKRKKDLSVFSTNGDWEVVESSESSVSLEKLEEWGRMLFRAHARGAALVLELGMVWDGGRRAARGRVDSPVSGSSRRDLARAREPQALARVRQRLAVLVAERDPEEQPSRRSPLPAVLSPLPEADARKHRDPRILGKGEVRE